MSLYDKKVNDIIFSFLSVSYVERICNLLLFLDSIVYWSQSRNIKQEKKFEELYYSREAYKLNMH